MADGPQTKPSTFRMGFTKIFRINSIILRWAKIVPQNASGEVRCRLWARIKSATRQTLLGMRAPFWHFLALPPVRLHSTVRDSRSRLAERRDNIAHVALQPWSALLIMANALRDPRAHRHEIMFRSGVAERPCTCNCQCALTRKSDT